jgi:hypothetical protein
VNFISSMYLHKVHVHCLLSIMNQLQTLGALPQLDVLSVTCLYIPNLNAASCPDLQITLLVFVSQMFMSHWKLSGQEERHQIWPDYKSLEKVICHFSTLNIPNMTKATRKHSFTSTENIVLSWFRQICRRSSSLYTLFRTIRKATMLTSPQIMLDWPIAPYNPWMPRNNIQGHPFVRICKIQLHQHVYIANLELS